MCVVPPLDAGGNESTAVELFLERARAVVPGFAPAAADLEVVADIVRRLDGLPLAIELAAARLHTHDVTEVAAGLDHRFTLLSDGFRTSSRHGSLRAAVSWSFELLDPGLQRTFADLSVFAGSFTTEDAAAVCGLDERSVSAALGQLGERSLVMRAPDRRFALLETLRSFGAEQLEAAGRTEQVRERHARHQVEWVERADRRLLEPGRTALADIDAAIPELRAALGWLLDHDEVILAGRLVAALLDYGFLRLRPDVMAWAERVAGADPEDRSPLAPRVWVAAAYAAWMAGDVGETSARSGRALRASERTGTGVPAEVASIRGSVALFEGRLDEAAVCYRRSIDASPDDRAQRLMTTGALLLALGYAGDPAVADLADALLAEVGEAETPITAYMWYCAGEAVLSLDLGTARVRYARALEVAARTNASFVAGIAGASKASIDARLGDPDAAARRLPAAARGMAQRGHVVHPVDDAALDRRAPRADGTPAGRRRARGCGAGDRRRAPHLRRRRGRAGRARRRAARGARRRGLRGGAARRCAARRRRRRRARAPRPVMVLVAHPLTSGAGRRGRRGPPCRRARG